MLILSVECMMPGITSSLAFHWLSPLLCYHGVCSSIAHNFLRLVCLIQPKAILSGSLITFSRHITRPMSSTFRFVALVMKILYYIIIYSPIPLFPVRSCPIYGLHLYFGMKIWLLVVKSVYLFQYSQIYMHDMKRLLSVI